MRLPKIERADLVLAKAQGGGLASRAILWGTRKPGEAKTRVSHAALVSEPSGIDSLLIESTWPRVIERRTLRFYEERGGVIIFRRRLLTETAQAGIVKAARSRFGERYGYGNLLWFGADAVIAKLIGYPIVGLGRLFGRRWRGPEPAIFRRLNLTAPVVCSQFVAWAYEQAGFPVAAAPWSSMSPDDLDDHCLRSDLWELVYESCEA